MLAGVKEAVKGDGGFWGFSPSLKGGIFRGGAGMECYNAVPFGLIWVEKLLSFRITKNKSYGAGQ